MRRSLWFAGLIALLCPVVAVAQDVVVGAPFSNVGDSFYESYNVSGAYNRGGISFNWGGGGALPPYGGYTPGSDAQFGFQVGGLSLGLSAAQGSNRFSSSQTPMVTLPNGGQGNFFDGSISPFVTGFVPVVGVMGDDGRVYGGGATMLEDRWSRLQGGERPTPLKPQDDIQPTGREAPLRLVAPAANVNSLPASGTSAEVAVASVEASRAAFLAESLERSESQRREFQETLDKAAGAAERGKAALAKAYLDQAVRNAGDDEERAEAVARLRALQAAP